MSLLYPLFSIPANNHPSHFLFVTSPYPPHHKSFMSSRKAKGPKKNRKKKKASPPQAEVNRRPLGWLNNETSIIAFAVLALISILVFLSDYFTLLSIRQGNIGPPETVKYWLLAVYAIVCSGFGYFAYHYLQLKKEILKRDYLILGGAFLSISIFYFLAFNKEILPNGDNAEYMILAKSLVERGGAYRLDTPNETPNSLASLGLPLLLSPIYAIWGFDFVKMKILIMALGIALFPLLFKMFRQYHTFSLSALLTITCFASPYLVSSAVPIMTEMPYMFWSILALFLMQKYARGDGIDRKYLVLSLFAVIMAYLTRAIGMSILIAFMVYLLLNIPWGKYLGEKNWKGLFRSLPFKKFAWVAAPILLFGIVWQLYQAITGISQIYLFFSADLPNFFRANLISAIWVLPQMLFEDETYRWYNFVSGNTLSPINFTWIVLLLILLFGLFTSLLRKSLLAIYTFFVLVVVLQGSLTAAQMVIIRYTSVVYPFLIYFFFLGLLRLFNLLLERSKHPNYRLVGRVLGTLALLQVLLTGFHGDRLNIETRILGRNPEYHDFLDVARWSKNNLPDDAYVLAIKPRIFYVLSGRKSGRLTSTGEIPTDDYILEKLEHFKKQGVTHIILDRMSSSTQRNIFPIVEEHPDLFRTLYLGTTASTSAVLKLL